MYSSDTSSETSMLGDGEDTGLDFEFGLEYDIQEVVRLGTLGQFQEARSLANRSLKQFDYIFPIAVEIMRLMYDQEDFGTLYVYTNALMSRRTEQKSWTPRALCILHLMHDVCGMLRNSLANVATTSRDMSEAGLSARNPENLDHEQIMITVLVLRTVYAMNGLLQRHPVVNQRTLPVALRQETGLYTFIGSLIHRTNYWAAGHVMTICLQLPVVDCAAIWKSTWRFLRGGSANDDEPTAYFRMQLMQTFMQGLLRVGHNSTGERSDAWSSVQSASDSLRPVLQRKVGRNDWLNSRGYWRGQFLEIDKALSDRNPQVRQPALRQVEQLLPKLHKHAARHDDRSLLDTYSRQVDELRRSTPQSPITYLDGALVAPIGGPANRNAFASTRSQPLQRQPVPATKPIQRSDIAVRSGPSARTAPASTSAIQPRPPWRHSRVLGGNFFYRPSTDMIMLQDGRQLPRPSNLPIAALSHAAWEGPPNSTIKTEASGSQRLTGLQRVQASGSHSSTNTQDQAIRTGGSMYQDRPISKAKGRAVSSTSEHHRGVAAISDRHPVIKADDTGQNGKDDEDSDDEDEEEDDGEDDEEQDEESEYESSGEDSE